MYGKNHTYAAMICSNVGGAAQARLNDEIIMLNEYIYTHDTSRASAMSCLRCAKFRTTKEQRRRRRQRNIERGVRSINDSIRTGAG